MVVSGTFQIDGTAGKKQYSPRGYFFKHYFVLNKITKYKKRYLIRGGSEMKIPA